MIKKIILVLVIIACILGIGYFIYTNVSFVDDVVEVPIDEPEIKEDIVGNLNIYLINKDTTDIEKETRNISLKELNSAPYETILKELKQPSTSSNVLTPIPENCSIISVVTKHNILEITLSDDFIKQNTDNNYDKLILKSIVTTINNLKEINGIKINIENNSNASLGNYTLNNVYTISDFKEEI